jgi:hypothetical protein
MISIAYECHPDGIHLHLERDLHAYTLEDLEPATEEEYQDQIRRIKNTHTEKEYNELLENFKKRL